MEQPLTPEEYRRWKDTALVNGDIIGRFAATIEHRDTVNAKLLAALEWLYLLVAHPVKGGRGLTKTSSEIIEQARAVIEEAKK